MRQRILLIILGVVILLAIYTFFLRPKPRVAKVVSKVKSKALEKTASVKEQVKSSAVAENIAKSVESSVKTLVKSIAPKPESVTIELELEKGKWGVDPFYRDWVLATELTDFKLKAITQSGTKAYVLINDQILEVGEVIGGKRIVSIEQDKVVLEQGEKRFTLILGQ